MTTTRFPPGVTEQIGFYVYILLDPRKRRPRPFYVGKGRGNRVFAHAGDALHSERISDKLDVIRAIHAAGRQVGVQIARHGLDEATALAVEAATIDVLAEHITNEVRGHGHERGLLGLDEFVERYAATPLVIREAVVLIRIATRWRRGMSAAALYEATRKAWRINPKRARKAHYTISVADGIVRAVYRDVVWRPKRHATGKDVGRSMFTACAAKERADWIGRSVVRYLPDGAQNPIRYVDC